MTITIPAFYESDTQMVLDKLETMGVNVLQCMVCREPILKYERSPCTLWERWRAWRRGERFYDWNISGVTSKGVICDRPGCFVDAIYGGYLDEGKTEEKGQAE